VSHTRDDQIDLEWYFNDATGDLSMPSSFGAMVARLQLGTQAQKYASSADAENYIERRIDACQRYAAVEEALELLSMQRQRVLEDAFEQCRCPVELVARPRHIYKAARASAAMRDHLKASGQIMWTAKVADEWLARSEYPHAHANHDAGKLETLRDACWAQGQETVTKALDAYGEARSTARRQSESERARRWARIAGGARL
jgi:ribosomal 50S subunit-associated protein YjgA (DUF615 family)